MSSVNNNVNVKQVQARQIQADQAGEAEQKKQREELFQGNAYSSEGPSALSGAQASAPNPFGESVGPDRQAEIQERIEAMSPEQRANFDEASADLLALMQDPNASPEAVSQAAAAVSGALNGPEGAGSSDDAWMDADNTEAIMEGAFAAIEANDAKLGEFALGVAEMNETKKQLGEAINDLRTTSQELDDILNDPSTTYPVEYTYDSYAEDGSLITPPTTVTLNGPEDIENLKGKVATDMENLEGTRESVGEDQQLAMIQLQQMMQTSQQLFQMLSTMAKMDHDTAKSAIGNIRA